MNTTVSRRILFLGLALAVSAPQAAEPTPPEPPRYTFSWPLDGTAPKPRGGSTRGAPVTRDTEPSAAWKALRAPGLASQERDRRAILAMAGTYRVSFDFLEVDAYVPPGRAPGPYQSWGTEKVYVDRDNAGSISLVHILEMRLLGKDGAVGEPFVIKHWRQDWEFEPADIVEYRGRDRWQRRALTAAERQGAWRQTVYQVDESPRYASTGRWQHSASFSTWLSADTLRPLPRREWSVRDDYQALLGSNRHTVGPTGWTQEENNLKAVLTPGREIDPERPYLAREYGMARYERLRDADFAAADRYQQRTRAFWTRVTQAWASAFAGQGELTLRGPVDKLGLFAPLFERAAQIEANPAGPDPRALADEAEADARVIRAALADMGVSTQAGAGAAAKP
jgi:hypothetical protein